MKEKWEIDLTKFFDFLNDSWRIDEEIDITQIEIASKFIYHLFLLENSIAQGTKLAKTFKQAIFGRRYSRQNMGKRVQMSKNTKRLWLVETWSSLPVGYVGVSWSQYGIGLKQIAE